MECSIPVSALEQECRQQTRSDSPVTSPEGRDGSGLTGSTAPASHAVPDSAEPAVVQDVSPAADSSKKDDDRRNAQTTKGRKVAFVTVKELDIDIEKGVAVTDVGDGVGGQSRVEDDAENVCRVCHLSSDNRSGPADLIQIGCGCKDDLGIAHRYCAEAWFKIKGNRIHMTVPGLEQVIEGRVPFCLIHLRSKPVGFAVGYICATETILRDFLVGTSVLLRGLEIATHEQPQYT